VRQKVVFEQERASLQAEIARQRLELERERLELDRQKNEDQRRNTASVNPQFLEKLTSEMTGGIFPSELAPCAAEAVRGSESRSNVTDQDARFLSHAGGASPSSIGWVRAAVNGEEAPRAQGQSSFDIRCSPPNVEKTARLIENVIFRKDESPSGEPESRLVKAG
jgi:hypothetical protein